MRRGGPRAPGADLPGVDLSDLVEHLGDVYTFWRAQLEAASPDARARAELERAQAAGAPTLASGSRKRPHELDAALAERDDPAEPCWNWSGADLTPAGSAGAWRSSRPCTATTPSSPPALRRRSQPTWPSTESTSGSRCISRPTCPRRPRRRLGGVLCLACADTGGLDGRDRRGPVALARGARTG